MIPRAPGPVHIKPTQETIHSRLTPEPFGVITVHHHLLRSPQRTVCGFGATFPVVIL